MALFELFEGSQRDGAVSINSEHKCAACFKQFNRLEHLIEHMKVSFHSEHDPVCGVCNKHCRTLDSLREHLVGPQPKVECAEQFSKTGCSVCLNVFPSCRSLIIHQATCRLEPALPPVFMGWVSLLNKRIQAAERSSLQTEGAIQSRGLQAVSAVSLDCEMVGGGQDGSLDICARVCLVDEDERPLLHTYVKPQLPVTNYRYDITGIKPEDLIDAMSLNKVQEGIRRILHNGETNLGVSVKSGRPRVIVGHGLEHDFHCLAMEFPRHLVRDTSKYPPLLKTSKCSNSLKYLTEAYLGYTIQNGAHDPYEDCVAAMRLYKRMRSQVHSSRGNQHAADTEEQNAFGCWKQRDLEKMTPDALFQISQSDYYCWCLDGYTATT